MFMQGRKFMLKHGEDNIWREIYIPLARGVRGHVPPNFFFFLMVQFGAFWYIFRSDFVFKFFFKLPFFYIKNSTNYHFLYKNFKNYHFFKIFFKNYHFLYKKEIF